MPWKKHLTVLLVAGILILIRSIYRVIEYAQGTGGQLISHEVYQYVLDAALMLIVAIIFNVFHPSEVQALLRGRGKYFIFLRSYHVEGRVIIPLSSTDGRQKCQV
jgi:predicted homoserine dehydrogenase-like protein